MATSVRPSASLPALATVACLLLLAALSTVSAQGELPGADQHAVQEQQQQQAGEATTEIQGVHAENHEVVAEAEHAANMEHIQQQANDQEQQQEQEQGNQMQQETPQGPVQEQEEEGENGVQTETDPEDEQESEADWPPSQCGSLDGKLCFERGECVEHDPQHRYCNCRDGFFGEACQCGETKELCGGESCFWCESMNSCMLNQQECEEATQFHTEAVNGEHLEVSNGEAVEVVQEDGSPYVASGQGATTAVAVLVVAAACAFVYVKKGGQIPQSLRKFVPSRLGGGASTGSGSNSDEYQALNRDEEWGRH